MCPIVIIVLGNCMAIEYPIVKEATAHVSNRLNLTQVIV